MAVDMMQVGATSVVPGEATQGVRQVPGAHARPAIARVVLETLERVRPTPRGSALAASSVIADAGIDSERFLDAICFLEGRYQMRFHASWLTGIRTCGDLIDRVADHMFDAADRLEADARRAAPPPAAPRAAGIRGPSAGRSKSGLRPSTPPAWRAPSCWPTSGSRGGWLRSGAARRSRSRASTTWAWPATPT